MSGEVRFVRIRGRIIPIRQKKPSPGTRVASGALGAAGGAMIGSSIHTGVNIKKAHRIAMVHNKSINRFAYGAQDLSYGMPKAMADRFSGEGSVAARKLAGGTVLKNRLDRVGRLGRKFWKGNAIAAGVGAALLGGLYATKVAQNMSDMKQAYKKSRMKPGLFDNAVVMKKRK